MKILVDTHIFLWLFSEPGRFSKKARSFVKDTEANDFYLSDASAWEATIKYGLGKLKLPQTPDIYFINRVQKARYRRLRIDLDHVTNVFSLSNIHRDPFDRLLISQASIEGMIILSEDLIFEHYKIEALKLADIS